MNRHTLKVNTAAAWRLNGRVWEAPAILIREGVHCGSAGCLLWPGETIEGMAPAWEGAPITLNHPMWNNQPVSCRAVPDAVMGSVIAPRYDPAKKALMATLQVRDGDRRLGRIQQVREVSIGVFSNDVVESGRHNGKAYEARVMGATPDHLALLEDETGACCWEDGCGIRLHREAFEVLQQTALAVYLGGNKMSKESGTLLPGDMRQEEEININAIEKDWAGRMMPIEVVALVSGQGNKEKTRDHRRGGTLLPPGVE
jgi:hypothetical protein